MYFENALLSLIKNDFKHLDFSSLVLNQNPSCPLQDPKIMLLIRYRILSQ